MKYGYYLLHYVFLYYFTFILKRVKSAAQVRTEYQHDVRGIKQINQSQKHNE